MAARKDSTKTDTGADDKATDSTTTEQTPEAKTAKAGVPCGCGCSATTKPGRAFVQGHDAKLHGILARALRDGQTEATLDDGRTIVIAEAYEARGWKPAAPRKSKKATPAERVAKLRAQLAEAEAALTADASTDEATA